MFNKNFTQSQHEQQFSPAEKELLVSYVTKTGIHNYGSYCNRDWFKEYWPWFKEQITRCDIIDMRPGKHGRNYFWTAETNRWVTI